MKDNYEICLMRSKREREKDGDGKNDGKTEAEAEVDAKVILVPYRPQHVKKYHEWMKSPFLLEMTGSEPLSYEEEVEMQQSWKDDAEKCTFIVLAKSACTKLGLCSDDMIQNMIEEQGGNDLKSDNDDNDNGDDGDDGDDNKNEDGSSEKDICQDYDFVVNTLDAMIGDVNLFLSEIDDDDDDDNGVYNGSSISSNNHEEGEELQNNNTSKQNKNNKQAELDIMIAEEKYRKMGMGKEATLLMMLYGAQYLDIRRFVVKIKEENISSRKMFEEKLGFQECNYVACFKEYEFEYIRSSSEEMIMSIQDTYNIQLCQWKSKLCE